MIDIDLNLLRIFDILYDERNVTRAAARLYSHAVSGQSCARAAQGDVGRSLVRANSLRLAANGARASACTTTASGAVRDSQCGCNPDIRPGQDHPTFAGSYFCMLIVPSLIALARKSAPGITLQIVNTNANLVQTPDQQQADIAFGAFDNIPAGFGSEVLFSDEKAWAIGTHRPHA
jgi:DNA-binding transcriptional LysR family regulator